MWLRCLVVLLLLLGLQAPAVGDARATDASLLRSLGEVAEQYLTRASEFSCLEVVRWHRFDSGGRTIVRQGQHRSNYLYSTFGSRELSEVRAPKRTRSMDQLEGHMGRGGVPLYVERAFFWILLFHPQQQEGYVFTVEDSSGLTIHFEPRPPVVPGFNEWAGSIEVDPQTFQPLRASGMTAANRDRLHEIEVMRNSIRELPLDPDKRTFAVTEIETEFGVERSGIRFPSKVNVTKSRIRVRGVVGKRKVRSMPIYEVRQIYKDYRFFGTETEQRDVSDAPVESTAPVDVGLAEEPDEEGDGVRQLSVEPTGYVQTFHTGGDLAALEFDLEEAGFLIGAEKPKSWVGAVEQEIYRLSNAWQPAEYYVQSIGHDDVDDDSRISVRVSLNDPTNADPSAAAGLVYRASPEEDRYYALMLTYEGVLEFQRRVPRGFTTLLSAEIEGMEFGRFYELSIEGRGGEFAIGLNGKQLRVVRDDQIEGGLPGIVAVARGSFAFDDLSLQNLPED